MQNWALLFPVELSIWWWNGWQVLDIPFSSCRSFTLSTPRTTSTRKKSSLWKKPTRTRYGHKHKDQTPVMCVTVACGSGHHVLCWYQWRAGDCSQPDSVLQWEERGSRQSCVTLQFWCQDWPCFSCLPPTCSERVSAAACAAHICLWHILGDGLPHNCKNHLWLSLQNHAE